jgi:predicted AlkP superfamily pyrophosphatase or phosphodiesterase
MVTGVRPARHGVIYNTVFDPLDGFRDWFWESSWIKVPTLWDLARQKGTAGASWPVTVGSSIDYLIPEGEFFPTGEEMLEYMRRISTPELVDAVRAKVPAEIVTGQVDSAERDRFIAAAVVHMIETYRPNLTLVHLIETDSAQHTRGKHTPEVHRAFTNIDGYLGEIIRATEAAGIRQRTTFVITGDHGFYQIHSALQPNVELRRAGLLKTDSQGRITEWKAIAHGAAIRVAPGTDDATRRQVRALFQNLADTQYRGLFRLVERPELDSLGAYPEAFFIIEPVEGYMLSGGFIGDAFVVPANLRGNHGYLPSIPAMHTGLIVSGYRAKKGVQVPLARQIDIAPTIGRLLGVEFNDIDGVPLVGVLEN